MTGLAKGVLVLAVVAGAYATVSDTEDRRVVVLWRRDLEALIAVERIQAARDMAAALEAAPAPTPARGACEWRDLFREIPNHRL